ncbi:hypothetical protein B9Z55_018617 [Caenorhabditis nigoni]|uniref:BPTI/Kunitz inhibitor domain-containing protein n=1 Tax=Caenorhabditis nigoni TaxID=1611254 RepID=A0A2G5TFM0_9PELO|nr:hypothetical protein B9Z55_018617 [Caenorhabditis nigoni]
MKFLFSFLVFVLAVSAQNDICLEKIEFGNSCSTAEPSIRFHFDNSTGLCMAFGYKGCGGNKNNFDTDGTCSALCKPTSINWCPVKSEPLKKTDGTVLCKKDDDCKTNGYCKRRLAGGGVCCNKVESDYVPVCGKGRTALIVKDDGNKNMLIGKNCDSNFCPKQSKCTMGNYFATCCKKL